MALQGPESLAASKLQSSALLLREVKGLRRDLFPSRLLLLTFAPTDGLRSILQLRPVLPRPPDPIKIRCCCGVMPKSSHKSSGVQHCSPLIALLAQQRSEHLASGVHVLADAL